MSLYNTFGIYGIHNKVNDMMYVGKTENSFGDRRDCHIAAMRGGYGVNAHLQRSWYKYGEDNFEFIVLHECAPGTTSEEVNRLEKLYIQKYRDLGKCYNFGDGGEGGALLGKHLSEETKRKIGEKNRINMTGKRASAETREKMSRSQAARFALMTEEEKKEYGRQISEYASGYKWSDEAKKNFSEMQKTRPNGAKYDVDTVHMIRHMHENDGMSFAEISKLLNIPRHSVYLIATYRRWANV